MGSDSMAPPPASANDQYFSCNLDQSLLSAAYSAAGPLSGNFNIPSAPASQSEVNPKAVAPQPVTAPGYYAGLAKQSVNAESNLPKTDNEDELDISDDEDTQFDSCRDPVLSQKMPHSQVRKRAESVGGALVVSDDDEPAAGPTGGWSDSMAPPPASANDQYFSCNLDQSLLSAAYSAAGPLSGNFNIPSAPASQSEVCINVTPPDSYNSGSTNYMAPSIAQAIGACSLGGVSSNAEDSPNLPQFNHGMYN